MEHSRNDTLLNATLTNLAKDTHFNGHQLIHPTGRYQLSTYQTNPPAIVKAKKSFGQHFLTDSRIAERIANSLKRQSEIPRVLEIGPGRGMLTQFLLQQNTELLVVEADRDMVLYLNKYYPDLKDRIISADFLRVDLHPLFREQDFCLIGNFPYNISSQIVFKMLKNRALVPELVGMFQKEMAERVVAPPGNKVYGVISVLTQAFYEAEYLFTVKSGSFAPPPKVLSAVIRLSRRENHELGCDESLFRRVVKQAFSQRRKMLRNTMKTFIKGNPLLNDPFFEQRPERLSIEAFVQLTNWIDQQMEAAKL